MRGQNGVGGALYDHTPSMIQSGNLTGFLRQQNRALVDLPWHIIQVHAQQYNIIVLYEVIITVGPVGVAY